jgi:adenylate cyclase
VRRFDLRSSLALNAVSISAVSILLAVALFRAQVSLLDLIELRTYDLRFLSRGPREPSPAIALAVIDERSLDAIGRWPWPRSRFAELVDAVSRDGARVIGFDIGFFEPDQNSELVFVERLHQNLDALGNGDARLEEFLRQAQQSADHDGALAAAMQRSSAPIVLGYFFHMRGEDAQPGVAESYRIAEPEAARRLDAIRASQYPLVMEQDPDRRPELPTAAAPEVNLPALLEAATSSGYFDVKEDPDGVVRWMPLVIQSGDALFPPLAVSMVWQALGRPRLQVDIGREGVEGIRVGPRFVPTDERGRLLIDYVGPPRSFPHYSISDILAGSLPEGSFRDRIVLVGASATGLYDARSTPFGNVFPGLEIHANVIDDILSDRFITRPEWSKIFDLLAIVLLGGAIGLVLPRVGAGAGLLTAALLASAHVLVARWLFVEHGVWLNIVYPLLALGTNYVSLTVYYYVGETRERKRIHGAFGRYVAPAVIEQMLEAPGRLELGGEEKVLTVLFSDIEDFTSFSERYTPRELIDLLSEYYSRMTERVFAHQGMLKEYVGDELMAIFGAPIAQPDHAARACAAALDMRALRRTLSEEWTRKGRPLFLARTGINTGLMLVGNLGSEYRLSYGVLGDQVNLGSRLEGLNKVYGTEILVGENTVALVGDAFRVREVDLVRVVGKKQPTRIYELLGHAGDAMPDARGASLERYAAGLQAYREQNLDAAESLLRACQSLWPGDGPARTLLERCALHRASPPHPDWDGVFEATSK